MINTARFQRGALGKGLWVGGMAPLGYETKDRRIVVVEEEAERVRTIFRSYLALGSLNRVLADLRQQGIVTKLRTLKSGRAVGGIPFTRGPLAYCVREADPSLGVRNRAAPCRSATWSEAEVARVAKRAWRMGYYGLAAVTAVAWDTQLSPGDVRILRASQLARGAAGEAFFTARGKTGVPVGGVLSGRAIAVLTAYLERLGVELHGDAYVFRNRSGARFPRRANR